MEQNFEKSPGIPGNLEDHTYEKAGHMLRKDLTDPPLLHLAIFKVEVYSKASFKWPG